jgi:urocanate hydratase
MTKPYEVTVTRTKTYWTCHYPNHRHLSQSVAASCERYMGHPEKLKNVKWTIVEYGNVIRARAIDHATLDQLAKKYNVSTERIRQVFFKGCRFIRNGHSAEMGLTAEQLVVVRDAFPKEHLPPYEDEA